jgi:hypothetical protein
MSEVVKPHARLSATEWLTNAVDAEPGMDLVWWDGKTVKRAEIIETGLVDGEFVLAIGEGQVYPATYINAKRTMVVE